MHIMGIVALGSMWLMMAEAARTALAEGRGNKAFPRSQAGHRRYFAERFLPDAGVAPPQDRGGQRSDDGADARTVRRLSMSFATIAAANA